MSSATAAATELKGLVFPPMPAALQIIREEQAKPEPDAARIASTIARDVGLASEVLRTINSSAFGLRTTISSIPAAIALLGLTNVSNIVSGAVLRASLSGLSKVSLERFWDTASDVALVSARVAKEYTGIPADTAHAMGLFHDCGIPMLMGLHADYGARVKSAMGDGWRITDAEIHYFGVHHAALGYHLARQWNLPPQIAQGILHHHSYPDVLTNADVSDQVRTLISVLKVGEHLSHEFRGMAFRREEVDHEWAEVQGPVLEHLAVGALEFNDLREALLDMLGAAR